MPTIFSSAARGSTTNSEQVSNPTAKGARFTLDITAASGTTPTLDVTFESYDIVSKTYTAIPGLAFAQKNSTGTDTLTIYPGIAETANETVSDIMPALYRAVATIGGTTPSFTFTLTVEPYA